MIKRKSKRNPLFFFFPSFTLHLRNPQDISLFFYTLFFQVAINGQALSYIIWFSLIIHLSCSNSTSISGDKKLHKLSSVMAHLFFKKNFISLFIKLLINFLLFREKTKFIFLIHIWFHTIFIFYFLFFLQSLSMTLAKKINIVTFLKFNY